MKWRVDDEGSFDFVWVVDAEPRPGKTQPS